MESGPDKTLYIVYSGDSNYRSAMVEKEIHLLGGLTIVATAEENGSVTINWTAPAGYDNISHYELSVSAEGVWNIGGKPFEIGKDKTSYLVTTYMDQNTPLYGGIPHEFVLTAILLDGSKVVSNTATATPIGTTYYILTMNLDGGSGTNVSGPYVAGQEISINAGTKTGYLFAGWTSTNGGTFADASSAQTTFTMPNGGTTITATWKLADVTSYTVTVQTNGHGTASASPACAAAGTTINLTATPDSGYYLVRWEVVSVDISIRGNRFTMPEEDVTVRAIFAPDFSDGDEEDEDRYQVIVEDAKNGEVTSSTRWATPDTTVILTVTPDKGYELVSLTITKTDGGEVGYKDKGDGKFTFAMPESDVTVEAAFAQIPSSLPFTDVHTGDWFYDGAVYVYEHGLMAGTSATTFSPNLTTSRGMIATILWRLFDSPVVDYDMKYADVAPDAYYAEAVCWAASQGVVAGFDAVTFGPDLPITREQLAVMLWRAAGSPSTGKDLSGYVDAEDVSDWARTAMAWAVENGIISGMEGHALSPQGQAARAQAAVMLMQFRELLF